MNKVQKWLAEKEAKIPSENYSPSKLGLAMYKAGRSISGNVKSFAGKIGSKITHQYNLMTDLQYNMDYGDKLRREKEEKERLAELRAEGFEPEEFYKTQWDNLDYDKVKELQKKERARRWAREKFETGYDKEITLASLVKAAREDEFAWDDIKHRDNLDKFYQARKTTWQDIGHDYNSDGKIRGKLQDIRKNAYRKAKSRQLQELVEKAKKGTLGSWDINRAQTKQRLYCKVTGEKPENFVEKLAPIYNEHVPSIQVSDFYKEHPGCMLVHGIRGVVSNNNGALGTSREKVKKIEENWRNFFDNVFDNSPTLSCSVVSNDSETYRIYGGMGVLIKGGNIQYASCSDCGTYAFSPDLRLIVSEELSGRNLRQRLESVIKYINPKDNAIWNEVIVAKPKVAGVFFVDYNPNKDHYVGSHCAPISELAEYAQSRGLPLFKFENGIGFTQVNPADYSNKPELAETEAA